MHFVNHVMFACQTFICLMNIDFNFIFFQLTMVGGCPLPMSVSRPERERERERCGKD